MSGDTHAWHILKATAVHNGVKAKLKRATEALEEIRDMSEGYAALDEIHAKATAALKDLK